MLAKNEQADLGENQGVLLPSGSITVESMSIRMSSTSHHTLQNNSLPLAYVFYYIPTGNLK